MLLSTYSFVCHSETNKSKSFAELTEFGADLSSEGPDSEAILQVRVCYLKDDSCSQHTPPKPTPDRSNIKLEKVSKLCLNNGPNGWNCRFTWLKPKYGLVVHWDGWVSARQSLGSREGLLRSGSAITSRH